MPGGEGQEDDANSDNGSLASIPVAKRDQKSTGGSVFFFIDRTPSFCEFNTFNNVAEQAHGQITGVLT